MQRQARDMARRSPYDDIAPMQRWSATAAAIAAGTLDPQGRVKFRIGLRDRVVSAGSCFAARIAERLRASAINYMTVEPAPALLSPEEAVDFGYLPFSARHGLVFSTLQLAQLFDRAFGRFEPVARVWERDGGYVDPFRPRIAPVPFATPGELAADRVQHLAAVRRMFERANVFVFTMGLTELWRDKRDAAVYPICPGLAGGSFDPAIHEFKNLSFAENFAALETFLAALRDVNPTVRVILTVSPVPIGATMEDQHVVRASTYTKSVLRAVAEEIARARDFVDYFASYEMVSQAFTGDRSFEDDRRHVLPDATARVVESFCRHYLESDRMTAIATAPPSPVLEPATGTAPRECDEDVLVR